MKMDIAIKKTNAPLGQIVYLLNLDHPKNVYQLSMTQLKISS